MGQLTLSWTPHLDVNIELSILTFQIVCNSNVIFETEYRYVPRYFLNSSCNIHEVQCCQHEPAGPEVGTRHFQVSDRHPADIYNVESPNTEFIQHRTKQLTEVIQLTEQFLPMPSENHCQYKPRLINFVVVERNQKNKDRQRSTPDRPRLKPPPNYDRFKLIHGPLQTPYLLGSYQTSQVRSALVVLQRIHWN